MQALEKVYGECDSTLGNMLNKSKKNPKLGSLNAVSRTSNMEIDKAIEPNIGVNILEQDLDYELLDANLSVKEESVFSANPIKFKVVKQGEPYRPSNPNLIKMSKSQYNSNMTNGRSYPSQSKSIDD